MASLPFSFTSVSKESACNAETWVWFLGWDDPLEEGMVTVWKIPWTEEPGGLQFMGLQNMTCNTIGHDLMTKPLTTNTLGSAIGNSIVKFLRNIHTVFHHGYTSSHSHQQCTMSPFYPHPPQHLFFCLFDNSHSDRCEVIFHCGSDLCFPGDQWSGGLFHLPASHLHLLFGKTSSQVLCSHI